MILQAPQLVCSAKGGKSHNLAAEYCFELRSVGVSEVGVVIVSAMFGHAWVDIVEL